MSNSRLTPTRTYNDNFIHFSLFWRYTELRKHLTALEKQDPNYCSTSWRIASSMSASIAPITIRGSNVRRIIALACREHRRTETAQSCCFRLFWIALLRQLPCGVHKAFYGSLVEHTATQRIGYAAPMIQYYYERMRVCNVDGVTKQ